MNKWAGSYAELQSLPSHCQPHQKIVVSEENRVKHRGINDDENRVKQIKVDGDIDLSAASLTSKNFGDSYTGRAPRK